jgi:bifunctional enzyme CysN/CysC
MSAGSPAQPRELIHLATAGSVDDGKSTLIGRLLVDTGSLLVDHLQDASQDGGGLDLAAITDGLRAEREQGITIDVAYRFFSTRKRSFILADTPGHESYTRNMFTGASNADVAIVLVDARHGVVRQTRRHAMIAALVGIRHVVACVNKMDLVAWDGDRFGTVRGQLHELARRLGIRDLAVIPTNALDGDNVASRSDQSPFYDGPALVEYLETVDVQADRDLTRLRLPIQYVGRRSASGDRLYMGRVAAGRLRVDDQVTVLPSGRATTVTSLDTLDPEHPEAVAPLSVTITLADHLDVGRGDMLVSGPDQPPAARELEATVCWMVDAPMRPGGRYALKHTSRTVRATVQSIHHRVDPETLQRQPDPAELTLNDIGHVVLRTSSPVLADPYRVNRETGAFILVDEHTHDTAGAGIVQLARAAAPSREGRRDVTWHPSTLGRRERWSMLGQRGATVLLTGLPASGKSTIAVALERRLVESGQSAYLLDGDNIRQGLSDDLGFSPGDRAEHIRRVGQVARLFADAGTVAVVSLISPLAGDRALLRRAHEQAGLRFIEVYVDTPLAECERRDPKGLYARARAGEIRGFTGIDAPYECPERPELHVRTGEMGVQAAVSAIISLLPAGDCGWRGGRRGPDG